MNKLNNHALSKDKYTRGNPRPFMSKKLSKAIMNQTRLSGKDQIKTEKSTPNSGITVFHY